MEIISAILKTADRKEETYHHISSHHVENVRLIFERFGLK